MRASNTEMEKNPVIIITVPESLDFYRALPLWDERLELHDVAGAPHKVGPLIADLVLIDCGFDDAMGLRLVSEIKLDHPGIPVMMLTDAGSEDTAVRAFRLGARDYIKKPVGLLELKEAVAKLLLVKRTCWKKAHPYIEDRQAKVSKSPGPMQNDLSPGLLRVVSFIKDNLARDISVEQMAGEAGLSKCHFCREFKKATGMPPMHFLSMMRIKRSKEYLRKKLPVSTIAIKVGFNDLSTFNRHFKRFTGQTPTGFRNSLQKVGLVLAISVCGGFRGAAFLADAIPTAVSTLLNIAN